MSKNNKYSKDFKLEAIEMYLDKGFSYEQVAIKMKIKSHTQVRNWVEKFKTLGKSAFDLETRGRSKGNRKGRPKKNFSSLEEEVKHLRMEVEYLKKLNEIIGRWGLEINIKLSKDLALTIRCIIYAKSLKLAEAAITSGQIGEILCLKKT